MRDIRLVRLDKTRPAVVLTRAAARAAMTKVTVAPITSTVRGLSSEVPVGPANGLDHECAVALDNVVTVPADRLGRVVGHLTAAQEAQLARAVVLAYDLDLPLLDR
ncbi:type II toxin-antitoxin system PemK/MazF family toxin [Phycicoccus sp. BSK3Z-2]|uniref:Type II toxin-antitoxin system PemK/MazF family toxin n=1 Tax=Phycicoccus avicenniae TaxID=2828860 RepID=A0A941D909_9MICO|nr:type II toxin-antitoxin system PemK/MazF family toxin [Phycicoccus avicenniae]MBR7743980.1 type II toxin-antitoxin system PemK/MazF family toxin [Phycicoccus avicenniae]